MGRRPGTPRRASFSVGESPLTEQEVGPTPPRWAGRSSLRWRAWCRARSARAQDTAAALACDVPIEIDERWIEVDYGALEGRALGDVPAELWARWRAPTPPSPRPAGRVIGCSGVAGSRAACEELFAQ